MSRPDLRRDLCLLLWSPVWLPLLAADTAIGWAIRIRERIVSGRRDELHPAPLTAAPDPLEGAAMASTSYVETVRTALVAELARRDHHRISHALLDLYTLLALTRGDEVTLRDVHDAWAVWRRSTRPDHPDLVPFEQLPPEVQELDRPYRDAIAAAARVSS